MWMVSPSLFRLKLTWFGPPLNRASAWYSTQPLAATKVKEAICVLVMPAMDGSSVRNKPLRQTGRLSVLESSNQSPPETGSAIHSLTRRFMTLPKAAVVALGAPGVGLDNRFHDPPMRPMDKFPICAPKATESTNWPVALNRQTASPSPLML